ncbi:hypothetical protein GWI33_017760 [Rhynchophorus ferrugineus]|uniref:Uncharacterized protein n=1 Tax=Rhynchophorus ferrugineus TaxID=354439 RepID=A0A834HW51_RHYFE|nr:hypothetical protein GWI33_017760 [Rhynchophorus ferrugineus]
MSTEKETLTSPNLHADRPSSLATADISERERETGSEIQRQTAGGCKNKTTTPYLPPSDGLHSSGNVATNPEGCGIWDKLHSALIETFSVAGIR